MSQIVTAHPHIPGALALRLAGGERDRARSILLAMAAYLGDKPENTRRSYKTSLQQFFTIVDWTPIDKITGAHATAFKMWLRQAGKSDSTICVRLAAVDGFFSYLMRTPDENGEPMLKSNPFSLVSRKDVLPTPFGRSHAVEASDFDKMLDALPDDPLGVRDRAVLIFLAYTGRRRQEVANLRMRDLDLKARPRAYRCRVKGGKEQTFELPDICFQAMTAHWMMANRLKDPPPDAAVFSAVGDPSRPQITARFEPHEPLAEHTIWWIVKTAARRAGLDETKVKTHGLRHMLARDLDRAGARLQDIQRVLGHASPSTTSIYLGQISGPRPAFEKLVIAEREKARAIAAAAAAG